MDSLSKTKVVLGLSGGVDSTTAALLLQKADFEVIGLYFDVHEPANDMASGADAELSEKLRAEKAAEKLGIKFVYKNVADNFREKIISNFCSEYIHGRTPNPCIICNPEIKFRVLMETADENGAYYIATGHYASVVEHEGHKYIGTAADSKKDQSYMLYRLKEDVISRIIFPLSDVDAKSKTREIALENDFAEIAAAKDSQEICFIDDKVGYKEYLKNAANSGFCERIPDSEGPFLDVNGNQIGNHQGIINYTIGQRKGLGQTFGKPMFVKKIDVERNSITLCENSELFSSEVFSTGNSFPVVAEAFAGAVAWDQATAFARDAAEADDSGLAKEVSKRKSMSILAKIRYAARPAEAKLTVLDDGRCRIVFDEPQRAVTPGQSVVFYSRNEDEKGRRRVFGGGFIE